MRTIAAERDIRLHELVNSAGLMVGRQRIRLLRNSLGIPDMRERIGMLSQAWHDSRRAGPSKSSTAPRKSAKLSHRTPECDSSAEDDEWDSEESDDDEVSDWCPEGSVDGEHDSDEEIPSQRDASSSHRHQAPQNDALTAEGEMELFARHVVGLSRANQNDEHGTANEIEESAPTSTIPARAARRLRRQD
jgi:ribosomal protein L12E/L44/L45/RPP1/RPP2